MKSKIYSNIGEQVFFEDLENGLRIIVVEKPDYSKSMAFFATHYGGADRRFKINGEWLDTPSGIAHFLEHKMFDMEDGNALTMLAERGASANAFTSSDITAYHFECTDGFYDNLKLLLQFVSTPYFTQESVDKEQGIIGQEIKMIEDNPNFVLYYNLLKALYADNPIRDSVAGTVDSIAEITSETLYDCHKIFYNPSNMVLCVVGNVAAEKVIEMARNTLPSQPGEVPERDYGTEKSDRPNMEKIEQNMEVGIPMFLIGEKAASNLKGAEALKQLITGNLTLEYIIGASSPLYGRLYGDGLINSNFAVEFEAVANVAYSAISGESKSPETVLNMLKEEIMDILEKGIDTDLFARLKKAKKGSEIRGLNSFDNICYNVSSGYFHGYDYFETIDILDKVSAADILDFIKENLIPENFAISVVKA